MSALLLAPTSVEIQVVLLLEEDRGLFPVTAVKIRLPLLKITLAPQVFRGHLLPAAAFPALGQEFPRLDLRVSQKLSLFYPGGVIPLSASHATN